MLSQCRHIKGCWESVAEHAHGTHVDRQTSAPGAKIKSTGWLEIGSYRAKKTATPTSLSTTISLRRSVTDEHRLTKAENGAKSTMTAILGRMATYSGQRVTWEQAMKSDVDLSPARYDWKADPPTLPDDEGRYSIPRPGTTRVV